MFENRFLPCPGGGSRPTATSRPSAVVLRGRVSSRARARKTQCIRGNISQSLTVRVFYAFAKTRILVIVCVFNGIRDAQHCGEAHTSISQRGGAFQQFCVPSRDPPGELRFGSSGSIVSVLHSPNRCDRADSEIETTRRRGAVHPLLAPGGGLAPDTSRTTRSVDRCSKQLWGPRPELRATSGARCEVFK